MRDASAAPRASRRRLVVHAAALKQVRPAEYNPFEAVKTNVIGAKNIIDRRHRRTRAAEDLRSAPTRRSIPSTCTGRRSSAPTSSSSQGNAMRRRRHRNSPACATATSSAAAAPCSVLPRQADTAGPAITDERMTRFWITLDQGVKFVLNVHGRCTAARHSCRRSPACGRTIWRSAIAPNAGSTSSASAPARSFTSASSLR